MRECHDKAINAADQCARNVDDIGIATNDTKQLRASIRTVFECIKKAGLKLTMSKFQVNILGYTITPDEVAPQDDKVKTFC